MRVTKKVFLKFHTHPQARYVSFLRPSDLMDGLVGQLQDEHPLPRLAASEALKALAPVDGNDALLVNHALARLLFV